MWAAVIIDELAGPFHYCQFLEGSYARQWYMKQSVKLKRIIIFMLDIACIHRLYSSNFIIWLASKVFKDVQIICLTRFKLKTYWLFSSVRF